VIDQEQKQHDGHDAAEEDNDREHFVLSLQVLHDHPDVGAELLSLLVSEDFGPQILLINQVLRTQHANRETIDADTTVQE